MNLRNNRVCRFLFRNYSTIFNGIKPDDINLFFTNSTRQSNGLCNRVREKIIHNLLSGDELLKRMSHSPQFDKWKLIDGRLRTTLNDTIGESKEIEIEHLGGRRNNYDFIIRSSSSEVKVEFKYGRTRMRTYPQVLSLYVSSGHLFDESVSYNRVWYTRYLIPFMEDLNYKGEIPSWEVYNKNINKNSRPLQVQQFVHDKWKNGSPLEKLYMKKYVDQSIHEYLVEYMSFLNTDGLRKKLEPQLQKTFLMCNNGHFSLDSISAADIDLTLPQTSWELSNKNTIVIGRVRLLLRWKNYKGCTATAWQISIR